MNKTTSLEVPKAVTPSIEGDVKTKKSCTPENLKSGVPTPLFCLPLTEAEAEEEEA